jgi:hypothetical protein
MANLRAASARARCFAHSQSAPLGPIGPRSTASNKLGTLGGPTRVLRCQGRVMRTLRLSTVAAVCALGTVICFVAGAVAMSSSGVGVLIPETGTVTSAAPSRSGVEEAPPPMRLCRNPSRQVATTGSGDLVRRLMRTRVLELLAHRALIPPPSSSLAEERMPLLSPPPSGGTRLLTLAAVLWHHRGGDGRGIRCESGAVPPL